MNVSASSSKSTSPKRENPRFRVRLSPGAVDAVDFQFLLEAGLSRSNSEVAVVYRLDSNARAFNAIALQSGLRPLAADIQLVMRERESNWLKNLSGTVQLEPHTDRAFDMLPETLQYRLRRVLVTPIRTRDGLLGIFTVGCSADRAFTDVAVEEVTRVGRLLTAIFERDSLQKQLEERKLVERAKGILQDVDGLTEEAAYLEMRQTSRNRRLPMAEIAREIIADSLAREIA